jgi:hypothetical protein
MRKLLTFLTATIFSISVSATSFGGSMGLLGVGGGSAAPTYQGPGDIVTGATAWGSCARAYNAAYANGTNPMCDLVDSAAPTVVICTLRVKTTGFVDLTGTYCTGSVTPATKCAAATGGKCNISQIYDQSSGGSNTNPWTQATAASQPTLTFAALNSLPVITCASSQVLATTYSPTSNSYGMSVAYIRTSGTAQGGAFGTQSGGGVLGAGGSANTAFISNGTVVTETATDSAWHGLQGTFLNPSSALNVDGTDFPTLSAGTVGLSSILRFCRGAATELLGEVAEGGVWPSTAFTSTQRGNLYNNMHGANGYNGAF